MFYCYIVHSNSLGQFYTGQTNDLERRLEDHNRGKTSHTSKGIPWILVYSEPFLLRSEAIKREKQIKKRGAKRFLIDKKALQDQ